MTWKSLQPSFSSNPSVYVVFFFLFVLEGNALGTKSLCITPSCWWSCRIVFLERNRSLQTVSQARPHRWRKRSLEGTHGKYGKHVSSFQNRRVTLLPFARCSIKSASMLPAFASVLVVGFFLYESLEWKEAALESRMCKNWVFLLHKSTMSFHQSSILLLEAFEPAQTQTSRLVTAPPLRQCLFVDFVHLFLSVESGAFLVISEAKHHATIRQRSCQPSSKAAMGWPKCTPSKTNLSMGGFFMTSWTGNFH